MLVNALFRAPGKETKSELGRCETLLPARAWRGERMAREVLRAARRREMCRNELGFISVVAMALLRESMEPMKMMTGSTG